MKKQKGITLIALVITIVILIILAGVAINLSIGENGILSKAKEARRQYEIADVREKIEIAMLDIESDQIVKSEECTVDTMVAELPNKINGITIEKEGNMAKGTYNGYNFTINENLKLYIEGESLAVTARTEVKEYIGKDANSKYAVKVLLTLEAEKAIAEVEIENTDGTITKETVGNSTYSKELEIELDKEYKVNVTAENGAKTSKKVSVSSTSEITNVEQFVAFRDNVNSGLTYEGATINLKTDIDLSSVCSKSLGVSWTPIGSSNSGKSFKGTFDGNQKTVKNIYIDNGDSKAGLFGKVEESTIKNLIVDNSYISCEYTVGALAGEARSSTINNCHTTNKVTVNAKGKNQYGSYAGGIVGCTGGVIESCKIIKCTNGASISSISSYVGGIVGEGRGTIEECYNKGSITINDDSTDTEYVGGIAGINSVLTIRNCYNEGKIMATEAMYVGGIMGSNHYEYSIKIYNSYNNGLIFGKQAVGGIIGQITTKDCILENCYNLQVISGDMIGGIVGYNNNTQNSTIKNCYYLKDDSYTEEIGTEVETLNSIDVLNVVNTNNTEEIWKIEGNGLPKFIWQ